MNGYPTGNDLGEKIAREKSAEKEKDDISKIKRTGRNISAYSVEDLPSNAFGRSFANRGPFKDPCDFIRKLLQFVKQNLGGIAVAPQSVKTFNLIRNFGQQPVIDATKSPPLVKTRDGYIYMPSGKGKGYDERVLEKLRKAGLEPATTRKAREQFEEKHKGFDVERIGKEIFVRPPGAPGRLAF